MGAFGLAAGVLGSPVLGALVDSRRELRKQFLLGLTLTCFITYSLIVPIVLLPEDLRFIIALIIYTLNQFSGSSVFSLLDAIVVGLVPQNAYGKLRLWCSVGYGTAAGMVGVVAILVDGANNSTGSNSTQTVMNRTDPIMNDTLTSIDWLPYVTHFVPGLLCSLIVVGLMALLRDTGTENDNRSKEDEKDDADIAQLSDEDSSSGISLDEADPSINSEILGSTYQEPDGFFKKLTRVPCSIDLVLFLMIILCCGLYMGFLTTFLFLFIKNVLHGSQLIMGICILVNCASEVPVFFFSEKVLNRLSPDWAICISLFAYVIRFGLYWIFTVLLVPAPFIFFAECLHGLTFALMWSATVSKATEMMSKINLINFGIGLITAIFGSGTALGALIAGSLLKKFEILQLWQGSTILTAVLTVLWIFYSWYAKRKRDQLPDGTRALDDDENSDKSDKTE